MHEAFLPSGVAIGLSFSAGLVTPTNFTGQPSLVMRAGFREQAAQAFFNNDNALKEEIATVPGSNSLWAPMIGDLTPLTFGRQIEASLGVANRQPNLPL